MIRKLTLTICLAVLLCLAAVPALASSLVYDFPLDSDPGWTMDSEWSFGSGPNCGGGGGCGAPGPYTGSYVFAISLGTSYPSDMGTQNLTTGALDCSALTSVYLRFWRWIGMTDDSTAAVQVSTDGSNWTDVWTEAYYFADDEWTECVYDISAVAAGQSTVYLRWTMTNIETVDCGGTCWGWTIDDIQLWGGVPPPVIEPETVYSFPMDYDPGWTTEGQWAFGAPAGAGGDPSSGYTGSNVYGYNLGGMYPNGMPAYSLTTTPLNCSGFSDTKLRFMRWLGVENPAWDHAYVQVSNDGSSWTTLWSNDGLGSFQESSWTEVEYDISSVADGQSTVYVRWIMGPTDASITYSGWNIDDVEIIGTPATEVLAWVPYVDTGWEWPNTLAALDSAYTNYNLTETTTTDPGALADELVGKHVFLVPEQEGATVSDLEAAGAAFGDTLQWFASSGGTVIVTGEYDWWSGFLSATGLLESEYQTAYWMDEPLPVIAPDHPLANGLGATIAGVDATSAYTVGPEATVVVGDGMGNAVVAVRQLGAGAVVVMGFDYYSWDASSAAILANAVQYPRFSRQVLLYESSPFLHRGYEALLRLNQLPVLADDYDFNSALASQAWNAVVGDVPNWVPQEEGGWQPFIDWIGAGGQALLSTWNLEGQTDLAAAFGVAAGPNLDEVPPLYQWDNGPPLFTFREQVPTALTGWIDYYWDMGVDANQLTEAADNTTAVAGFTVDQTEGEAAVVMGNNARTFIDGFLWDDGNQDDDGDGIQDVVELVMNQALMLLAVPMPDFDASVLSGDAPLSVDFTGMAYGAVTGWHWDFGDGSTSDEQNPTHLYIVPGVYPVSLTCSNINGSDMVYREDYISVGIPPAPVADFSATPTSGNAPLEVTFNDQSAGAMITAWAWDFGDGGSSTDQNPTHTYTTPGTYDVSLTVTDIGGTDDEVKVGYITVGDANLANFSGTPRAGVAPLGVTFTDLSGGGIVSWLWDFGDGGTATTQNPSHTYNAPGIYDVSLTVNDGIFSDTETKTDYVKVGFPDTPPDFWAFDEVLECVDAGVVTGYDTGLYDPEGVINRAQMATYTARALAGSTTVPAHVGPPSFPDVQPDFWAFDYIEYAVAHDVVQGFEDGNYYPDIELNRGAMAVFIARAVAGDDASVPAHVGPPTFTDVPPDFWSYRHVEYCVAQGIVSGFGGGIYNPDLLVNRGAMAVYIAHALPLLP
ncbi:MAG: PKD domain-containing protein [Armatimonadota bacterium]